jgi:hypothetical protein
MMRQRGWAAAAAAATALCALPAAAGAHTGTAAQDGGFEPAAGDRFQAMTIEAAFPLSDTNSSDLAFWGDRVYAGSFRGFRIFDVSGERPKVIGDVRCEGAQGDVSVWDTDGDRREDILILSVDRTMSGPQCGATPVAHDAKDGWEGLRIFDVRDPKAVTQIATVYQDCGSHTHTVIPRKDKLVVLNSSYPLRPGPTCGPVRGPEAGRDPLHGVVQVVEVPFKDPRAAKETTELPLTYVGDKDNNYKPVTEHNIEGGAVGAPGLIDGMRACHDIAVHLEAGLVGAACAEQAQVWRLDPKTGLPDTTKPLWVYDQDNVDFWHSATFTWDGKVANFIDESFGDGCPTTTLKTGQGGGAMREFDTGNMFFMDARSGALLSEYRLKRGSQETGKGTYCSSHLGNVVPATDRYLLANAYYRAGSSVIDFTDPAQPKEIAYADRNGAGTWSTYWYETAKNPSRDRLRIFANDGIVNAPAERSGFEQLSAKVAGVKRGGVPYLNPQTQETTIPTSIDLRRTRPGYKTPAGGRAPSKAARPSRSAADHLATP